MPPSPIDVTLVVNLHEEGEIASPTLESARETLDHARAHGISCEMVLVLDRADAETRAVAERYAGDIRLHHVTVGDLGTARNCGAAVAAGRYVAFLDGDDLCGKTWITSALREADREERPVIVHPSMNMFFGRGFARYFWTHPDMRVENIPQDRILVENLWTSTVLMRSDTARRYPYPENHLSDGFGYEDWVWNFRTIDAGIPHITAPHTIAFIRRKKTKSLMVAMNEIQALPNLQHDRPRTRATALRTRPEV